MSIYLDSSAGAKLLVEEEESAALARHLDTRAAGEPVVSSALLETELRRVAVRLGLGQADVTDLLSRLVLVDPDRALFTEAGLLPGPGLRSLDALHLATAVRVQATSVIAYDTRLLDAARTLGLQTAAPA